MLKTFSACATSVIYIFCVMMNFFFLHLDPKQCARYHGDKHLNKMQTEYAQILSFVWYNLVFERLDELGEDFADLKAKAETLKSAMYKKNKAHLKHPTVLWASKSQAHYFAVLHLGLALGDEKRRRIANMKNLPRDQQPKKAWQLEHKSEGMLKFLQTNVPPLALFPKGDQWTDPPKCMPAYLHTDSNGEPFSCIDSYRLFYAGNKVIIAELKWEPYVEEPDFIKPWQHYIKTRPDIEKAIQTDLEKDRETKQRAKEKRKRNKRERDTTSLVETDVSGVPKLARLKKNKVKTID